MLAEEEIKYKVDEIEAHSIGDRVDLFVEYKPDLTKWTLRAFAKNVTNSPVTRIPRPSCTGQRGTAPISYVEKRVLNSGPYFGLSVQRTPSATRRLGPRLGMSSRPSERRPLAERQLGSSRSLPSRP